MAQPVCEQVERLARMIWSRRFFLDEKAKIARRYGFTKDEIRCLNWDGLPDAIKRHVRHMAEKEVGEDGEAGTGPQVAVR